MKKANLTVFATSLLIVIIATQAQAVELYNGESFCDEVVQSQDIDLINLQHRAWVSGWIDGTDLSSDTEVRLKYEEEIIWQSVISYCNNKPEDDLYGATIQVYFDLLEKIDSELKPTDIDLNS